MLSPQQLQEIKEKEKVLVVCVRKQIKLAKNMQLFFERDREGKLKNSVKKYDIVLIVAEHISHTYQEIVKKNSQKYYIISKHELNFF